MLNTPMIRLATIMPTAATERTAPSVDSSVRSSSIGVSRVCRKPMQKVTTVIRAINTVMPECWRRKLIPCRKSAQKPVVVRRGGVLTVRHTSSMHATVRTMVAMSIVSTVVIPEEAMSNPAMAGEIRYWDIYYPLTPISFLFKKVLLFQKIVIPLRPEYK